MFEAFCFFKQKTAYEIKECDWSSELCCSDLINSLGDIVEIGWRLLLDLAEGSRGHFGKEDVVVSSIRVFIT